MRARNQIKILTICFAIITIFTVNGCGGGGSDQTGQLDSASSGTGIISVDNNIVSVMIAWDPPSYNDDGTLLTDLAGYKIYYGTSTDAYTQSIDVGNNTVATIDNLTSGTWCFSSTAYNAVGNESDYSNEICTSI